MLEHPAALPVHRQPVFGLNNLRKVLDRIFFFKEAFLFFQATVPALLRCQCDSAWLEGSIRGVPPTKFCHKSTFNAVLANTEKVNPTTTGVWNEQGKDN